MDHPNNCRDITLSNCLGKLFNTILYNRLQNELQKILFYPLPRQGVKKITELLIT